MPNLPAPIQETGVTTREGDVVARFIATQEAENTQAAYNTDLRQFFRHAAGRGHVADKDVEAVYKVPECVPAWFAANEWKPATKSRKIQAGLSFFEWYAYQRQVHGLLNPFSRYNVRRPKHRSDNKPKGFLRADYEKLLAYASRGPFRLRDRALVLVGVSAALRRSELLSLTAEAVVMYAGKAYVRIGASKAGSGDAQIRISKDAYKAVQKYRQAFGLAGRGPLWVAMKDELLKRGGKSYHPEGTPINKESIRGIISRLIVGAGLDESFAHPHVLRHTFGHMAGEAGKPMEAVRQHMRHKSINTTQTYYRINSAMSSSLVDEVFG